MKYLENLNDKQREAAMYTEGALLILAGAGSGKTSTMTRRIAYLVDEKGVSPYNILAVTFTNKAAREMEERVEEILGSNSRMWIMTFHAACLRMLRMDGDRLGYTNSFAVYDPVDQKSIVKNLLKEYEIDEKKFTPNSILSNISKAKEQEIGPREFEENAGDFRDETVAKVYRGYERILSRNNAMDFDDLILNAVRLLKENPDVLEKYQERFRYIMVDEYQDTNQLQYKLISLLAKKYGNICVVGDDDQCIYQWRGADIRNILNFEKEFPKAKVVKLEQNYRSTANILEAAHSVISNNKQRKRKKLWTDASQGEKIQYHRLESDYREAGYIAQEIGYMVQQGENYRDFAILYRTNAQSRNFEDSLAQRRIPYRVIGGLRYYDRMEIKDMIAYMRLVANPMDDIAFDRVVNSPKRGIGKATMDKIKSVANYCEKSIFQYVESEAIADTLSGKASRGMNEFLEIIREYSEEKENLRVSDIYEGLLIKSGYLKALEDQRTAEADGRIENLMEFKSVIYEFENRDSKLELDEFLEKLALLSDVDNHDSEANAVTLMTMHSAKGLEFPYVFMPGMEDGLFPSWRSRDSISQMEEERRLCYVGMTRAKRRLWMTSAESRLLYGKVNATRESEFMREINPKLLAGDGVYKSGSVGAKTGSTRYLDGRYDPISGDYQFQNHIKAKSEMKKKLVHDEHFEVGDRVIHGKFGEGVVLEVTPKIIRVEFVGNGVKKLAVGIAPIKKM
ncbi:MAG: UvrD-helicase domain-containing protein [[Eubacterium] brachy]|jgi:ATP-dependent DNA helicase pcrA|nr:UvrD-helicase domain-containing protein [[Eubacterium] brachy]